MEREIIPTVFAKSRKYFTSRLENLRKISKEIQIDIMDGVFVSNKSIGIEEIPNLSKLKNRFEAHLMVKTPEIYIDKLKRKGIKKIIFHYESFKDKWKILELINKIKDRKMEAWIAVNPETDVDFIIQFVNEVDGVLFMGVNPGMEHQRFINRVYSKIEELRKFKKDIKMQVDGGINIKTAGKLGKIGVDIINTGSFVAESYNPQKALRDLKSVFR